MKVLVNEAKLTGLFVSWEVCYCSTGFDHKMCPRTRKVTGPFEKRAPGLSCSNEDQLVKPYDVSRPCSVMVITFFFPVRSRVHLLALSSVPMQRASQSDGVRHWMLVRHIFGQKRLDAFSYVSSVICRTVVVT